MGEGGGFPPLKHRRCGQGKNWVRVGVPVLCLNMVRPPGVTAQTEADWGFGAPTMP